MDCTWRGTIGLYHRGDPLVNYLWEWHLRRKLGQQASRTCSSNAADCLRMWYQCFLLVSQRNTASLGNPLYMQVIYSTVFFIRNFDCCLLEETWTRYIVATTPVISYSRVSDVVFHKHQNYKLQKILLNTCVTPLEVMNLYRRHHCLHQDGDLNCNKVNPHSQVTFCIVSISITVCFSQLGHI